MELNHKKKTIDHSLGVAFDWKFYKEFEGNR